MNRTNGSQTQTPEPCRIDLRDPRQIVSMSCSWGVRYCTYECQAGHRITVITLSDTRMAPVPVGMLICPLCQAGEKRTGSTPVESRVYSA